jgi:hypothetical protein
MPKSSSTKAARHKKIALPISVADAFFPQQDVGQAINYQSFYNFSTSPLLLPPSSVVSEAYEL